MRVRRSLLRVWTPFIAVCALVAVAMPVGASTAQASRVHAYDYLDGALNGHVLDEQGQPIPNLNADIALYAADGTRVSPANYAPESTDGAFSMWIWSLPEGEYYIGVDVRSAPYDSVLWPGYNEDGTVATFHVTGETLVGAEIYLHKFTALTGVVSPADDMPSGWANVDLVDVHTGGVVRNAHAVPSDGVVRYYLSTEDLPRGEYAIRERPVAGWSFDDVSNLQARTYLGGVPTLADATRLLLAAGETREGLDIPKAADTAAATWAVKAWNLNGGGVPATVIARSATGEEYKGRTDDGGFGAMHLPAGTYEIQLTADGFAPSYLEDAVGSRLISVPWAGSSGYQSVAVEPGHSVSGAITSGGAPLVDAEVSLVRVSDWSEYLPGTGFVSFRTDPLPLTEGTVAQSGPVSLAPSTYTDATGHFEVPNVPDGTYTYYVDGQYQGSVAAFDGGSQRRDDALTFNVAGTDVDLGTAAMPAFGTVSGTVTWDETASRAPFFIPMAFAFNAGSSTWELASARVEYASPTDTSVTYGFQLTPGTYRIAMANVNGGLALAPGLAAEYYQDVLNIDDATTVTVTNGTTRAGVNFALSALSPVSSTRYAGADRYATAVEVSKTFSPGVSVVYVASGENFPDALAAAPAAAASGGPLLTVRHDGVPDVVAAELARLNPDRIVVVGGLLSVDAATYNELATYAGAGGISRVFGANRYATAQAIVDDYWGTSGSTAVWIASGKGFPDALSAAAAAGSVGAPVITVDGSATTLDPAVVQMIQDLHATTVYIAGGFVSVSASLEAQLKGVPGVTTVTRRAGGDRYSTGAAINYYSFDHPTTAYIANGTNFPDALAGAALAGHNNAPLYIVPGACVPNFVVDDLNRMGVTTVNILGGTAAVNIDIHHVTVC